MALSVSGDHTVDASLERAACTTAVVINVPLLVVAGGVIGTTTQRVAEEDIADLVLPKCLVDGIARELRPATGIRHRAHIADVLDAVAEKEVNDIVERPQPVTDGEDRLSRCVARHGPTLASSPDESRPPSPRCATMSGSATFLLRALPNGLLTRVSRRRRRGAA